MLNKIIEKIQAYDSIVIFRHEYPDMDALGSQLGLKQAILDNYPNKNVYALGSLDKQNPSIIDDMDIVDDALIEKSLAIITDTSNTARVDDKRFMMAKESIRIDHHVLVETMCDIEAIDPAATAACELIALGLNKAQIKISKKAAQLLYSGMIADSIRYTIGTVRPKTFQAAAYLIEQGADVIQCEEDNFSSTYEEYCYETKVRNNTVRKENALVAIMEQEDYAPLSFADAKGKVYCLSGVEGIHCWGLFTRMADGKGYAASLRSKHLDVRSIAADYNGGGHVCAAGIKNLTREQVEEIIDRLAQLSKTS